MKKHTYYYNKYAKLRLDTFADYFPKNYTKEYNKVRNITIIAITGGQTDLVVDPPTEIIDGILPPKHGFSVMTSYIPGVDRTIDHHGIVFCNKWIDKLREAIFTIYNNESHSLYEDRFENIDRLADILLPPENEYNKLYHDMLEGFTNVVKEKLSFFFYLARISLNYTPSSNASAVMVFLIITYYILLMSHSKPNEWSFCYFINPVLHYKSIKSTYIFKYVIIITTIFQTIKWILTGVGITAAPNLFSVLILYTGGISFLTAEYMVCYILLCIGSLLYTIFLYVRQFFKRNPVSYRVYEILTLTSLFTILDIVTYYPTCLTNLYKITDILKLLIVFIKRCIVCFELLCIIACRFEPCGNLDCLLTLSAAVRLALFFEQMSIYSEENVFLNSPPGKFDWSEMGIYFYSVAVEIPIGMFFYLLYKLSLLKYSYKYSKLQDDEEVYEVEEEDDDDEYFDYYSDYSDSSDIDDGISLTTFSRCQSRNISHKSINNKQSNNNNNNSVRSLIPKKEITIIPIQIVNEVEKSDNKNPDDVVDKLSPLPTISELNNNIDNNSKESRNIPLLSSLRKVNPNSLNSSTSSTAVTTPPTSLRSLLSSVNKESLSNLRISSPFQSFRHINPVTNRRIKQLKARLSSYKTYIQIYFEWIMFILYFTLVKANFFVVIIFGMWMWGVLGILYFNTNYKSKRRNLFNKGKTETAVESIQSIPI